MDAHPPHATAPGLPAPHGFFGRQGGVTEGLYASLNCGVGSADDAGHVAENRRRVAAVLGQQADRLVTLHQHHSADCLVLDAPVDPARRPKADAAATRTPGLVLGVLAADCVPVLLSSVDGAVVGAAHAGWRGAVGGVLEAPMAEMARLGADRRQLIAAIGPCIRQPSYEVGLDLVEAVLKASHWAAHLFAPGVAPDKRQFDLPAYVQERLVRAGIGMVFDTGGDSYTDRVRCFSARANRHAGETVYGRMIAAITPAV